MNAYAAKMWIEQYKIAAFSVKKTGGETPPLQLINANFPFSKSSPNVPLTSHSQSDG